MYITIYFNQLTINVLCEYVISSTAEESGRVTISTGVLGELSFVKVTAKQNQTNLILNDSAYALSGRFLALVFSLIFYG